MRLLEHYYTSHMDKMADLCREKIVSLEIDHFRQICKLKIFKTFRKTDCHIQFAVQCSWQTAHSHTQTSSTLKKCRVFLAQLPFPYSIPNPMSPPQTPPFHESVCMYM